MPCDSVCEKKKIVPQIVKKRLYGNQQQATDAVYLTQTAPLRECIFWLIS